MPTEAKVTSIATKLSNIMGELGSVEKKGHNKTQNYDFVREADIVAAVVPLLSKNHLVLHTTIVSHTREPLYTTQSGMTMWITTIFVDGTWIDGDTGETQPVATFVGTGADTGDKGVYKAMTGAEKYMLLKSFLISTGDDPEADEKVDKSEAAAGAAAGPVRVSRGKQAGVKRGGKSSVATTAQVNEIARLSRDLKLDAETIGPVLERVVGEAPEEGESIRAWLGSLTSDQAASIIMTLSEPVNETETEPVSPLRGTVDEPVDTVDNPAEDGAESDSNVEPEALSIV